jgi:hypothetical protein
MQSAGHIRSARLPRCLDMQCINDRQKGRMSSNVPEEPLTGEWREVPDWRHSALLVEIQKYMHFRHLIGNYESLLREHRDFSAEKVDNLSGAVKRLAPQYSLARCRFSYKFLEGGEVDVQNTVWHIHTAYEEVNEDSKFSRLGLRNRTRDAVNNVNTCKDIFGNKLREAGVSDEDMALADKVLKAYNAWRKMAYPQLPVSTQTLPGTGSGVTTARASVDGSWELLARMQELRSMRV